jgi:hypothetical protein
MSKLSGTPGITNLTSCCKRLYTEMNDENKPQTLQMGQNIVGNGRPKAHSLAMKTPKNGWNNEFNPLQQKKAPECVWFLEHPPLYTLGTSGHECDVFATTSTARFFEQVGVDKSPTMALVNALIYLMMDLKNQASRYSTLHV